jgi:DNA-binding protein HU-beta
VTPGLGSYVQEFMRKDGLIDAVMKEAGIEKKKTATTAVETVFNTISKTLSRGEEVGIAGFGIFKVVRRKARMGVNPKTGEKLQIPAANKPKFQAGKALKDAVN